MIRIFLLASVCLVLTACATPAGYTPQTDVYGAQATYAAAQQQAQMAANRATAQAAQATAVSADATRQAAYIATSTAQAATATQIAVDGSLASQMTVQAITIQGTNAAIASNATATAVAHAAIAEQSLVEDEAHRLAIQREQETIANDYRRTISKAKPWLWAGIVLAVLALSGAFVYRLVSLSRPVNIKTGNGDFVTALPSNRYQIYTPRPKALPVSEPPLLPDNSPITLPPLKHGHVLIAGETGSGKSTAMRAVLQNRGQVVILDPHNKPGEWGNHRVIGGGRDFDAIGEYMQYMRHELSKRYTERLDGRADFDLLTVATDEMPAIVATLGNEIGETWREWLREGRKVGLFFAVSTQSTRVTTLGIKGEGDLLSNFQYALILGQLAEAEYRNLVTGMERPAVLRTLGGARPIVIPHVPAGQLEANEPSFTAPEPQGIETQWGYITPLQISQILDLKRAGRSGRYIETEVFDQDKPGGNAYYKVKAVLDYYMNGDSVE